MHKLLIGINDKDCSLRAVSWVLRQYRTPPDLEVALMHVIPNLPARYWDDGHILTEIESEERNRVIESWAARQRDHIEPILQGAARDLIEAGFPAGRVRTTIVMGTSDITDTLLDEAKAGGFTTIVVGRCGIADGNHFLVGSFVSRLIQKAVNLAICVAH